MNGPAANAIVGLPALIGVIFGLKLYSDFLPAAYLEAAMLIIAFVARSVAFATMADHPKLARYLIELWIVSAVAVTAAATAGVTWLTLNASVDLLFNTSKIGADQLKTITAAFVTALTTYVALVWTKDIGDARGYFWPSTAFKKAMNGAYQKLNPPPGGASTVYAALYLDSIPGFGNLGWGFSARKKRAEILADYIGTLPPNSAAPPPAGG